MPFPRSYFNGLFWQRGWVPFVEAFLMFWSFAILAFKAKIFSRQKQSMLLEVLPVSISADINAERLPEFTEHIRKLPIPPNESFLINRVLRGLEHFRVRGSASEVANMLESQSEIDATSVGASYTLVKVFIWAIPILGFIGTVQGLGDAVGGFSGKMAGATDISVVKDSLGDITKGLGVAFDTTLIALVMSLLLMLPMSTLEKNEEDLLNSVDEYCNENLLKRLDDGGGGGGGGSGGIDQKVLEKAINAAMAQQQAELAAWTKKLEAIAGTLARQVIEGWKSVNELQAAQHQKQLVADKAAAETILAQQHELLSELVSVHKSLSERSETMKSSAEAEIAATQDQLQLLRESVISLNSVLGELGGRQIVVENRASLSGGKRRWPWGSNGG
jgi:hypothetical protein